MSDDAATWLRYAEENRRAAEICADSGLFNPAAGEIPHVPNDPIAHVDDFWSRHPMGVNFVLCDGSVRMINNTIKPQAWVGVATRAGGEVFSLD